MAVRKVGGRGKGPYRGHDDVLAALMANTAGFALCVAYQEELENSVFGARGGGPDKERRMHERLLLSLNTLPVLQFIWKESPFVSDEALAAAGVRRMVQGGPLTMHGLTMLLHSGTGGAGAAVKRVAKIARAAKAYGLIETNRIREKMVEIAGTKALHEFMLRVRRAQANKLPPPGDGDGDD